MNEFYQLIQDTVSRSPIGAKAVAVKIGKPYSTMMREVNPNDKGAKVGADTLMDIVRATKDISPLVFMAKELGYRLVPVSKDEGEEDSAHYKITIYINIKI